LQRILIPAGDAQRQPRHRIDAHKIARSAEDGARPKIFMFGKIAEFHNGFVVQVKRHLKNGH
jgi:hypothetical protein